MCCVFSPLLCCCLLCYLLSFPLCCCQCAVVSLHLCFSVSLVRSVWRCGVLWWSPQQVSGNACPSRFPPTRVPVVATLLVVRHARQEVLSDISAGWLHHVALLLVASQCPCSSGGHHSHRLSVVSPRLVNHHTDSFTHTIDVPLLTLLRGHPRQTNRKHKQSPCRNYLAGHRAGLA